MSRLQMSGPMNYTDMTQKILCHLMRNRGHEIRRSIGAIRPSQERLAPFSPVRKGVLIYDFPAEREVVQPFSPRDSKHIIY